MALERFDLVQDTATTTGTGPFTMAGAPTAPMRAFSVHTVGATFDYRAFAGNAWEIGVGTLTDATHIARNPTASSNGGALVNFTTAPTVIEIVSAASFKNMPSTADGMKFTDLTTGAPTSTSIIAFTDQATGDTYKATIAAILALASGSTTPPADTTAPVLSTPSASSTGTMTASGSVTTNEGNGTLYYLVSANATETAATIKAANQTQAVASAGSKAVSLAGLTASSTYYLHFVQVDAAGNTSNVVDSASFTTAAAGDTTAPTLSSPVGTATGANTATATVSTNEAGGTLYYMVSVNATETAATVKAGSSQAVTATGTQNVSFSGLTASTTYYSHFLHRDAAGNDSTVANGPGFTTQAAAATMASIYKVTTGNSASMVASTTTLSVSAPDYYAIPKTADGTANQNVRVNVRGINDASLAPSATQCKFVFGLKNQPCPITSFATVGLPQGVNGTQVVGGHGNGFVVAMALTGWTPGQTSNGNYGTITPSATFYGWFGGLTSGQSVTAILWVVFDDNSSKAFHDGAGVPIEFIFTAP